MEPRRATMPAFAALALAAGGAFAAQLVEVAFDPAGGALADDVRVVSVGGAYGSNVNLYPSGSTANFADLPSAKIALADNVFSYSTSERWCNFWTKPIEQVRAGRSYTYVIDVLEYANESSSPPWFNVGQTHSDQSAQLSSAAVQAAGTGRIVCGLSGRETGSYSLLGRDFVDFNHSDGGKCSMRFRVQLYAGSGAVPPDGGYAAPGEGVSMPLPVPTWTDHVFLGWTNSMGEAVTEATVVANAADHVLGAVWKEWRVDIGGAERPRPGIALTASTNYGSDGEPGEVSFSWMRGDWAGNWETAAEGAEYSPSESDYAHFLKAVLSVDGKALAEKSIWFSRMPVVYVETEDGRAIVNKEDRKNAHLRIQGNAEFKQQYDGATEIKGRGNSSWNYPKKPYKLKLDKKTDLFGFGKNKHWVLLANFIDESSLRNKTAYDFSGVCGLEYMDSTWVDVVFNGSYDGLYQLCEHIRVGDTRVDIHNWEDDVEDEEDLSSIDPATADISGGYLFELSNEFDEESQFKLSNGVPVMVNTPEFLRTNTAMMDWCSNFWERAFAAWYAADGTNGESENWQDLADVGSMASYWLVQDAFGNDDAWYKSRFAYKDIGGKLTFGPVWDFDWGCGTSVVGTNNVCAWRLAKNNYSEYSVSFYKEWLDDPWFCLKALEKFRAMRPVLAELVADGGTLDRDIAYLAESGAADDARWDAARRSEFGDRKRGFAQDAAMFKRWMKTRLAWLDSQFTDLDVFVASVRNDRSASPFVRTAGTLSVNGSAEREVPLLRRIDAEFSVSAPDAASVDVMLNGRPIMYALPVSGGVCSFRARPFDAAASNGERSLLAVTARRADGTVAAQDYVTLRAEVPPGFGIWIK